MGQKLESMIKKGKVMALIGLASLAIGCASVPPKQTQNIKPQQNIEQLISPSLLPGKSLDNRFSEFNNLSSEQQINLAKSLNDLSAWDSVLLARYAPVDGIIKDLSSFYSIDYKAYLQTMLFQSGLNPMTVGLTGDKGLGQLSQPAEKWARELYNNKKLAYKFPGQEITDDSFNPNTNLILSSILFKRASEQKVADLGAIYSIYVHGLKGVTKNQGGFYTTNDIGANAVSRAREFNSIANEMMIFSWISMNKPELKKYIEDENLRKVIDNNNGSYEGKIAYEGMINFLNALSTNTEKYSDENIKMFKSEAANISGWINGMYSNNQLF